MHEPHARVLAGVHELACHLRQPGLARHRKAMLREEGRADPWARRFGRGGTQLGNGQPSASCARARAALEEIVARTPRGAPKRESAGFHPGNARIEPLADFVPEEVAVESARRVGLVLDPLESRNPARRNAARARTSSRGRNSAIVVPGTSRHSGIAAAPLSPVPRSICSNTVSAWFVLVYGR
jgi:hypothetical protein